MNPVKANIVKKECEYKYSSYNDYLNKTGFLDQRILKFLFLKNDYIEKFKSIPYEDVFDKKIETQNILKNYLEIEKIDLEEIKTNKKQLIKFLKYLKINNLKYSKLELANILEISKATLYRKIKQVKENEKN